MKLTMKEIAKLASVSQATVSRVINGNQKVSEEAAKRVLDVIENVGFVPNKAAQTLKQSTSHIIGVSVTETYNPYFVELIEALEVRARKKGYSLLLHISNENPVLEWENVQNFLARQVDGMIIVPTGDYNLERISRLATPSVVLTQQRRFLDCVGLDHVSAGKMAAKSFILAGHRTFGFVGTAPDDKFFGYRASIDENGFSFSPAHYIELDPLSKNNFLMRKDIEAYLEGVGNQLAFTCLFAANDIMAIEFMKALRDRGLRVPEDVAIIGFDDTYLAKILGLSSIHQPIEEMVKTAFQLLIDRIEQQVTGDNVHIKLPPTLIERTSSAKG